MAVRYNKMLSLKKIQLIINKSNFLANKNKSKETHF